MTYMPKDRDEFPIPALRLKAGGSTHIDAGATAARNAQPFLSTTRVISLYATGPVFVSCGDASVAATVDDHYVPAGFYMDIAIGGGKVEHTPYISVLRADYDCTVYVSERA